jgi:uncharacterized HAD superfamily protein
LRIGIDIDGCLFDVLTPTLNEYNLRYNTNFKPSDITDYHAHKILGINVSRFIELLDFIWINDFNSIRPYEQDINLSFKKLHGKNHQIIIVTRRNVKTIPNVINVLKKWSMKVDGFVVVNNGLDKTLANVDVMIDDSKEVINLFGYKGYLIQRPYNPTYDIKSIGEFVERFLSGKIKTPNVLNECYAK